MHLGSDCMGCLSARATLSRIRFAVSVETRRSFVITGVGKGAVNMMLSHSFLEKAQAREDLWRPAATVEAVHKHPVHTLQ